MASTHRWSMRLLPTTKPSVSSRSWREHNLLKEAPHADPSRCRPRMLLDEGVTGKFAQAKRSAGNTEPVVSLVLGLLSFSYARPRAFDAAVVLRKFERHAGIPIPHANCRDAADGCRSPSQCGDRHWRTSYRVDCHRRRCRRCGGHWRAGLLGP